MIFKHEAVIDGKKFEVELYTSKDVAKFLEVSIDTVYKWQKKGILKPFLKFGLRNNICAYKKEHLVIVKTMYKDSKLS